MKTKTKYIHGSKVTIIQEPSENLEEDIPEKINIDLNKIRSNPYIDKIGKSDIEKKKMKAKKNILKKIKALILNVEPEANIILYGSYARGENREDSDIDILILLDKDKISLQDEINIKYPLYELEFETSQIISPMVFAKKEWETRHRITPFYENIKNEGVSL